MMEENIIMITNSHTQVKDIILDYFGGWGGGCCFKPDTADWLFGSGKQFFRYFDELHLSHVLSLNATLKI